MIIERFLKALKRKGITQKQLAKFCNTSESAVSRWVSGGRGMSVKHLKETCKILEVSSDWLIGLTDKEDFDD